MIKVGCNSSPIIGLSIIIKLNLLWELLDEVYITEQVYKEIVENNEFRHYGSQELKEAALNKKVKLHLLGGWFQRKKL